MASSPVLMFLKSEFAEALYPLLRYAENCGMAMAARMAMMATTIRSSIRVKPFLSLLLKNMYSGFNMIFPPINFEFNFAFASASRLPMPFMGCHLLPQALIILRRLLKYMQHICHNKRPFFQNDMHYEPRK